MAQYSRRICSQCGVIKPQPEMTQRQVKVRVGKSTSGFTWSNYLGVMLGEKGAKRKFRQQLWANNKRNYTRYKKVWVCNECVEEEPGFFEKILAFCIDIVFYGALAYVGLKLIAWIMS